MALATWPTEGIRSPCDGGRCDLVGRHHGYGGIMQVGIYSKAI